MQYLISNPNTVSVSSSKKIDNIFLNGSCELIFFFFFFF